MTHKREVNFTPAGQTRTLHIWLPQGYEQTDERYPVMYFFDGHNLFDDRDATYGKSWGFLEFLSGWEKQLILVGVECSHEGANRLVEYCPYHFRKGFLGEIDGTGDATVRWMVEELKPMIDREYRTIPFRECTAIGGSSMGGLMSLYTVVRYNRWFSKAACLSSTIAPCMEDLVNDIGRCDIDPDTRVYLAWGSEEGRGTKEYPRNDTRDDMALRNSDLAARLELHGASTRLYGQEGGRHCEADWEKQVPGFMNYLWMNR
ncbi:MAG: alpha/beta hydrolase-fold protein [Clostridia bacterium]|nr:alpha/beta hydrolase-fold protein [Clostridia bacterium]